MNIIRKLFHKCFLLERSSKGIEGMILKCKECNRRYVVKWHDYKMMDNDVSLESNLRKYNPT